MFAGPNGSGKSTLKSVLRPELLGVYINPDDIERDIRAYGFIDVAQYGVDATADELRTFFRESAFLNDAGFAHVEETTTAVDGRLHIDPKVVNSYVASAAADFLRQRLLDAGTTFTLETVMSHRSKVELLKYAQRLRFRTYLYFIATDNPDINISRVQNRVRRGGHGVPENRIVKRYHASLSLLIEAIRHTNRAYIFDNSGEGQAHTWLAEVTEGKELEMKTARMPAWFKHAVWDKIFPNVP